MRSLRIEYNACNSSARKSRSGAIDGLPAFAYISSNRPLIDFQRRIHHRPHRPQRMLLRHPFFQRSIQKHLGLLTIISAHIFKANPNFKKSHVERVFQ
jgi:hypothetical protein